MNAKISLFLICIEAIMYLLLSDLHHCTFKTYAKFPEKLTFLSENWTYALNG